MPAGGGDNIYNRPVNRPIEAAPKKDLRPAQPSVRPGQGPNNVFADRNGDVFRKNGDAWQGRDNNAWKNADAANQPARKTQPNQPGGEAASAANRWGRGQFRSVTSATRNATIKRAKRGAAPQPAQQPKAQATEAAAAGKPQQPKPQQPKAQPARPQP